MTDTMLLSVDPSNGLVLAEYAAYNPDKVNKAISLAKKAQQEWSNTPFRNRAVVLKNIAKQLRKEKEKLARLATQEMGKPIQQSRDELEKCAKTLEFYAQEGAAFLANEIVATDAHKSYISFQPMGVVLAIMPWNFPYWQVFRCMAPILMGGNTMLLKHASNVSGCALAIEKVIKAANVPKGLFQTLLLPAARVEELIAHPIIAALTFTGSTEAGRKVAEAAGRHLKKVVLELGGSDPYIILEDADLNTTVDVCVNARLVNTGQSCVAAKRFIAVKSIRKEFEKRLVEQMKQATYGNPMDTNHKIGAMARVDLRTQLHEQVLKSIEKGAKLLCGGYIPDGAGAYYPPTVLTNVKKGMPAYHEELFGPVAAIIEAKDETDAMRIANDSDYGLGGAIFSKNRSHAEKLAAHELQAGSCFVNAQVHSDARMPFGGIKHSGYGRELGIFGIREFVNAKSVFIK